MERHGKQVKVLCIIKNVESIFYRNPWCLLAFLNVQHVGSSRNFIYSFDQCLSFVLLLCLRSLGNCGSSLNLTFAFLKMELQRAD